MNTLKILLYLGGHVFCIYTTSVILSATMFMGLYLKIYKDLALNGQKLDLNGIKLKIKILGLDDQSISIKRGLLTFGYNFILMLSQSLNYEKFKYYILASLADYIVPLSENEIKIFNKHPNGLSAYLITKLNQWGISTFKMNIVKNGEISNLKCLIIKDDIFVIKATGYLKGKRQKELKEIVFDYLIKMVLIYQRQFTNEEELINYLNQFDEFTFEINENIDLKDENVFTYNLPDGEILWHYSPDFQDIEIISAFGSALNMDKEAQKKIIKQYLKENTVNTEVEYFDSNFRPCENLDFSNPSQENSQMEDLKLVRKKNKRLPH